jgi:hypothetical protein
MFYITIKPQKSNVLLRTAATSMYATIKSDIMNSWSGEKGREDKSFFRNKVTPTIVLC